MKNILKIWSIVFSVFISVLTFSCAERLNKTSSITFTPESLSKIVNREIARGIEIPVMESYYNLSQIYSLELRLSVEGDYSAVYEKVYSKNIMPVNENTAPVEYDQNEQLENFFLTALRKPIVIDDVPAGSRVRVRLYGCISVTFDIDSFRNMLLQDGEPEEEINNKLDNLKELLSNSEENPIRFEGESEEILVQEGDNPVNIVLGYTTENQGDDPDVEEVQFEIQPALTNWELGDALYLYGPDDNVSKYGSSASINIVNIDGNKIQNVIDNLYSTEPEKLKLTATGIGAMILVKLEALQETESCEIVLGKDSYPCHVKSLLSISENNVEYFRMPDTANFDELISYVIPPFVTSINSSAVGDLTENIKEVDFSACGITQIPENLFMNCTKLEKVSLPSGLREIDSGAFAGCTSLSEVIFNGTFDQWNDLRAWGNLGELGEVKLEIATGGTTVTYSYDSATGSWIENP